MYAVTAWMVQSLTGLLVGTKMEAQEQKEQTQPTIKPNKTERRKLHFQHGFEKALLKLQNIEYNEQMGVSKPYEKFERQKCQAKIDAHLLCLKRKEERERLQTEHQKKKETFSYLKQQVKNLMEEETRLEKLVSNKLCLTLTNYENFSHKPLDAKHWPGIECKLKEMIRQKLLNATHSFIPRFQMAGIYKGFLLITCDDAYSKEMVLNCVNKLADFIKDTRIAILRASRINDILQTNEQRPAEENDENSNVEIKKEKDIINTNKPETLQKEDCNDIKIDNENYVPKMNTKFLHLKYKAENEQQQKIEALNCLKENPISSQEEESRLEKLISNSLCLALACYKDNSHNPLDAKHWPMIETEVKEMIRQKLLNETHNNSIPRFEMTGIYKGYLIITCKDDYSKQMVINCVNKLHNFIKDEQLTIIRASRINSIIKQKEQRAAFPNNTNSNCEIKKENGVIKANNSEKPQKIIKEDCNETERGLKGEKSLIKENLLRKPLDLNEEESRLEMVVSNKLCLTLTCYKNCYHSPLDAKHWPVIETKVKEMILEKLLNETHNSSMPRFQLTGTYKGYLLITCNDEYSKQMVVNCISKLQNFIKDVHVQILRASRINSIIKKEEQKASVNNNTNSNCAINSKQDKIDTNISQNTQKELIAADENSSLFSKMETKTSTNWHTNSEDETVASNWLFNIDDVASTSRRRDDRITTDFSVSMHPKYCSKEMVRYYPSNNPNRGILVSKRAYDYEMELEKKNPEPSRKLSTYKQPRDERNLCNFNTITEKESSPDFERRPFKVQTIENYGPFNEDISRERSEEGSKPEPKTTFCRELKTKSLEESFAVATRENYESYNEARFGQMRKEGLHYSLEKEPFSQPDNYGSFHENSLRRKGRAEDSAHYQKCFSAEDEMKRDSSRENYVSCNKESFKRRKEEVPHQSINYGNCFLPEIEKTLLPENYGSFNEESLRRRQELPHHSIYFENFSPPEKQSSYPHSAKEIKRNSLIKFPSNFSQNLFERRAAGEYHTENVLEKRIHEGFIAFKEGEDLAKKDFKPVAKIKRKLEPLIQHTTKKPAAEFKPVSSSNDIDVDELPAYDLLQAKTDFYKSVEYLRQRSGSNINSLSSAEKLQIQICQHKINKYEKLVKRLEKNTNANGTNREENPQTASNNSMGYVKPPEETSIQWETSLPPQINTELQIAIIDRNNEDLNINTECWLQIEKSLLENLAQEMERTGNTNIGMFNDMPWQNGIKIVKCENLESLNFIKHFIHKHDILWTDKRLDVIPLSELPKRSVIKLSIPPPYLEDNIVLKLLKGQNYNLKSGDWTLINSRENPNKKTKDYYLSIAPSSLERLKLRMFLVRYGSNTLQAFLSIDI